MSAQHTPGPLTLAEAEACPGQYQITSNFRGAQGEWDDIYVSFGGYFGSYGPHVFAAAPDLLEALELVWPFLEEDDGHGANASAYQYAINQVRAAIAKAKGIQ